VLSRDVLLLTSAAVILVVAGYRLFQPSIYGKLTTALQIMLVFAVVLLAVADWPWLQFVRVILGYLVAAFTVFSGFHYSIVVARRLGEQQHVRETPRRCATNRRVCSAGVSPVFLRRDGDLRKPPARRRRHEEPQSRRRQAAHPLPPNCFEKCGFGLRYFAGISIHEAETSEYGDTCNPASRSARLRLVDVGRLPIRHHSTKQVPPPQARRSERSCLVPRMIKPKTAM